MWLQKDERHLLMGYYVNMCTISVTDVQEIEKPKWFQMSDWISIFEIPNWLRFRLPSLEGYFDQGNSETPNEEGGYSVEHQEKKIKEFIKNDRRLRVANAALEKRNLIKIHKHEDTKLNVEGISLTIDGYDLGMKYSNWLKRSGLWFAEYRNHWIWLIVSFFGGVIGAVLVNWFSKLFDGH